MQEWLCGAPQETCSLLSYRSELSRIPSQPFFAGKQLLQPDLHHQRLDNVTRFSFLPCSPIEQAQE